MNNKLTDEKIKPCPFCGGESIAIHPDEYGSGGQHVPPYHASCDMTEGGCGVSVVGETEEEAIATWNRRAALESEVLSGASGAEGASEQDEDAQWTTDRAADLLEHYAGYIREVKPDDLERHPYLPEIDYVAQQLRHFWQSSPAAPVPPADETPLRNGQTMGELEAIEREHFGDISKGTGIYAAAQPPADGGMEPSLPATVRVLGPFAGQFRAVLEIGTFTFHVGPAYDKRDDAQWTADTLKRQLAAALPPAGEPVARKLATALDMILTKDEAEYIAAFVSDSAEQDDDVLRLMVGDGHSGYGLYVSDPDYPEEGAIFVKATPSGISGATEPAGKGGEVAEVERLRVEQAEGVMPQIGPLLDAWDSMDNDTKAVLREDAPDLAKALSDIGRAMDGTSTQATEPGDEGGMGGAR